MSQNNDLATVEGFGEEWRRFNQTPLTQEELNDLFSRYFSVFPWASLPRGAVGFDLGCGSGRWAKCIAPRVGRLHCVDASPAALDVARRNLAGTDNCEFHLASVESIPLPSSSMDFGYSLGVLHHVPDTAAGLRSCVEKLKPGAPFLVYLYYSLDNRPAWYRLLWAASDFLRRIISTAPSSVRYALSQILAAFVYYPCARGAALCEALGMHVDLLPLSYYRKSSFYTMRTDALDRFGTRLEQRFSRRQVQDMMGQAGLERISFSESMPHWVAVGYRKSS
jgi:SAM-dependent methyltransferase